MYGGLHRSQTICTNLYKPLSAIVLSADSVVEIFKENTTRSPMLLNNDEAEEILNAAQTVILCANHQRKLCSDILTLRLVPCSFVV